MKKYNDKKLKKANSPSFKKVCLCGALGVVGAWTGLAGGLVLASDPTLNKSYVTLPSKSKVDMQGVMLNANFDLMRNRLFIKKGQDCQIVVSKELPQYVTRLLEGNVTVLNKVFDVVNNDYNFVVKREGEDGASLKNATISVTSKDIDATAEMSVDRGLMSVLGNVVHKSITKAHLRLDPKDFLERYSPYLDKAEGEKINPYMEAIASRALLHELMHCLGAPDYETKYVNGYYVQCFYDTNNQKHFLYNLDGQIDIAIFNNNHLCMNRYHRDQFGVDCYGMQRVPSILEYSIVNSFSKDSKLYETDIKLLLSNYNLEYDKLQEKYQTIVSDNSIVVTINKTTPEGRGR